MKLMYNLVPGESRWISGFEFLTTIPRALVGVWDEDYVKYINHCQYLRMRRARLVSRLCLKYRGEHMVFQVQEILNKPPEELPMVIASQSYGKGLKAIAVDILNGTIRVT